MLDNKGEDLNKAPPHINGWWVLAMITALLLLDLLLADRRYECSFDAAALGLVDPGDCGSTEADT